jgi:hypothetical protein
MASLAVCAVTAAHAKTQRKPTPTFQGWRRHVTLVAVAQAFATMLRLDSKVRAPA